MVIVVFISSTPLNRMLDNIQIAALVLFAPCRTLLCPIGIRIIHTALRAGIESLLFSVRPAVHHCHHEYHRQGADEYQKKPGILHELRSEYVCEYDSDQSDQNDFRI